MSGRLRAAVLAEMASARLFAAEIQAASLRRAEDLARLRADVVDPDVRAALHAAKADLLALCSASADLQAALAGDLGELVAAGIPDEPGAT